MDAEIEEIVKELKDLYQKKPLSKEKQERARELMVKLKEAGFTNKDISTCTGWSEETVKSYTKGSEAKDSSQKEAIMALLSDLIDRGLTIKEVEEASRFLKEIEESKFSKEELFKFFEEIKKAGISYEDLKRLSDISKKLGGYEAIERYWSLKEIEEEIKRLSDEREKLRDELEKSRKHIEIYRDLEKKGFDVESLEKIKRALKFGGLKEVLDAINAYKDLSSIKSEISKLKIERDRLDAEIKKLNSEYAHLQTVIDMCKKLLYDYKFTTSAIGDIYKIAEKYGRPLEVIKALDAYESLKSLKEEVESLSKEKAEIEAEIKELEKQVAELEKKREEVEKYISETLKSVADSAMKSVKLISSNCEQYMKRLEAIGEEIKKSRSEAFESIAGSAKSTLEELGEEIKKSMSEASEALQSMVDSAKKNIDLISSNYEQYVAKFEELGRKAGKLEEELNFARKIQALIFYPHELKEVPIDEVYRPILRAMLEQIEVLKKDPEVMVGTEIASRSFGVDEYGMLKLSDLVKLTIKGLREVK